jgi:hypothetical protein
MKKPEPLPWSAVFHRSRLSPYVFVVAKDHENEVLREVRALAPTEVMSSGMFDHLHRAWPMLDGAVAQLDTYGMPLLPSGVRVYGHGPMRLLVHVLGLRPPRRLLTGEKEIRDPETLLLKLGQQHNRSTDELQARAQHAMASDAAEVMAAVAYFFGTSAAREGSTASTTSRPKKPATPMPE